MDNEMRNAYLAGLKLKNSGLSEEVIYARIEKQGFPEALARQVARDVIKENETDSAKSNLNYGIVLVIIGVVATIISWFVFADKIIIPIGLIVGGLVLAVVSKSRLKNK